jgi:hypothetical protein
LYIIYYIVFDMFICLLGAFTTTKNAKKKESCSSGE